MKPIYFYLATIILVLSSCSSHSYSPKYPGFSQISKTIDGANFYVDINSISETPDGTMGFKLLQVLPTGYAIQDAGISYANQLVSLEGIKYLNDGSVEGKFQGVEVSLNQEAPKGLLILAHFVREQIAIQKSFTGTFEEGKALQALYGQYRPDLNGSLLKNIKLPYNDEIAPEAVAHVMLSQEFNVQGEQKHLLLVSIRPDGYTCHVCVPLVCGALYRRVGERWELESQWPSIDIPGQFGEPCKCSWDQVGANNWALVTNSTDGEQGVYNTNIIVIKLDKDGATGILNATVDFDDTENAPDCKLNFRRSPKNFWDATLTITYKKSPDLNRKIAYVYANGAYQESLPGLQSDKAKVPSSDSPKDQQSTEVESPSQTRAGRSSNAVTNSIARKKTGQPSNHKNGPIKTQNNNAHGPLDPRLFLDH